MVNPKNDSEIWNFLGEELLLRINCEESLLPDLLAFTIQPFETPYKWQDLW